MLSAVSSVRSVTDDGDWGPNFDLRDVRGGVFRRGSSRRPGALFIVPLFRVFVMTSFGRDFGGVALHNPSAAARAHHFACDVVCCRRLSSATAASYCSSEASDHACFAAFNFVGAFVRDTGPCVIRAAAAGAAGDQHGLPRVGAKRGDLRRGALAKLPEVCRRTDV